MTLAEASKQAKTAQAELIAAIREARTTGMSLRAIAAIVEMSPETVRKLAA